MIQESFTLTQEEAASFSSLLAIDPSPLSRNLDVQLLDDIVIQFQSIIPFQNVFLLSTPVEERRLPTWDEVKQSLLTGQGGLCYMLNLFLRSYLSAIGFNARLSLSSYGTQDSHTVILVYGVEENVSEPLMIDVGSGYAQHKAISLNFEVESPWFQFSYTKMQLKRKGDRISRLHWSDTSQSYKEVLDFSLTPVNDIATELAHQHRIFTDSTFTPFYKILAVITFPQSGAKIMQDSQYVLENTSTHKLENQGEEFTSEVDFAAKIKGEFPAMNEEDCVKAFQHLFGKKVAEQK